MTSLTDHAAPAGRRLRLSLSTWLIVVLSSIGIVCTGSIIAVSYVLNARVMLNLANADFQRSGVSIIDNVEALLQPVSVSIDQFVVVIENTDVIKHEDITLRHLYEIVALNPQIYAAYVGFHANGTFLQAQRIPPGSTTWGPRQRPVPPGSVYVLRKVWQVEGVPREEWRYIAEWGNLIDTEFVERSSYDPRQRPFYRQAWPSIQNILTDIYVFASNNKPGITIARRFAEGGAPAGVLGADLTLESLSRFLRSQPVGANGIAMIVDKDGQVVAAPDDATFVAMPAQAGSPHVTAIGRPDVITAWRRYQSGAGNSFVFPGSNGDYLAAFHPFPQRFSKPWIIMEVAPVDDFVGPLKTNTRNVSLLSLVIAALVILGSLLIARGITRPVGRVVEETDRIRRLDFEGGAANRSRLTEIQQLIDSVSAMKTAIGALTNSKIDTTALNELTKTAGGDNPYALLLRRVAGIAESRRAQDLEMELAAEIQRTVLPRDAGEQEHSPIRIAARMRAAKAVGGDFYDWIWRDDRRLVFAIGDVSGKGVPAAFFMAIARTAIRSSIVAGSSISEALFSANNLLSSNNERCFFVTVFMAEIDLDQSTITFASAGHEPAFFLRPGRELARLSASGIALGVMEDMEFESQSVPTAPGDLIMMMTDGITDAVTAAGEAFGMDRVAAFLAAGREGTTVEPEPGHLVDSLIARVDTFVGGEEQFDDITCLAIRVETGPRSGEASHQAA